MNTTQKISALLKTKQDILSQKDILNQQILLAKSKNAFFSEEFIGIALKNIFDYYLTDDSLNSFTEAYNFDTPSSIKTIGLVMAGNIPMVGFHDFLCCYLSPHNCMIKLSQKDEILIKYFIDQLSKNDNTAKTRFSYSDMLKGCDAYIATGSNTSATYFQYYFGKYPNIIRDNKTSVAILTGNETTTDLEKLADDVFLFFGLGCRNVTKIYVPNNYNFEQLITVFKKYNYLSDYHKFKNNFDYHLALAILNNTYYMATDSLLLMENQSIFSNISVLHYEFYENYENLVAELNLNTKIQCIVGTETIAFGDAQKPNIFDFADGIDTMKWLQNL